MKSILSNNKFKTSMIVKTLTIILLTIFSTSCNKNEDEIVTPAIDYSTAILGKWEFSKQGTFIDGVEANLVDYPNQANCFKDNIIFASGNSSNLTIYRPSFTNICTKISAALTYTITDKKLELTGGAAVTYEIVTITSTELKYRGDGKVYVFNKM